MAEESRVTSVAEEIMAQTALNADAILRLRNAAFGSAIERKALQTRLNALEEEKRSPEDKAIRQAAYRWILGQYEQAEAAAKNAPTPQAYLIRGCLALAKGEFGPAVEQLQKALDSQPNSAKVAAELAAALRSAGKISEALKVLEKAGTKDSDVLLQQAWCYEAQGLQEEACNGYTKVLELDPANPQATFRLAYYLDLRGEDDKAIALYQSITQQNKAFVNAMINLALIYEDKDDFDTAVTYLKEALKADPSNKRAKLYLRDAIDSLDMYYDEGQRKESDRLESILRIPINDFELSVRSRNCLAKMNVRTLGDMVKKTEPELLAYKNFGETSLREIKQLLESKGLRLGMHKEDEQKRVRAQRLRLGPENSVLTKPIADLELSVRSRKCMQRLNLETIGDLANKTEADLLSTKNFGQTSLTEVKTKLTELGLSLKCID
jgi:DNA-directed RNA polymerase subunit alpha